LRATDMGITDQGRRRTDIGVGGADRRHRYSARAIGVEIDDGIWGRPEDRGTPPRGLFTSAGREGEEP
jgi:hypothetical protein